MSPSRQRYLAAQAAATGQTIKDRDGFVVARPPRNYILACDVKCTGPHSRGKGYSGYLATAPSGETFVAEARTGAIVGDSLESVRADIKTGKPAVMREQVREAAKALRLSKHNHEFEVKNEAFFWKALNADIK